MRKRIRAAGVTVVDVDMPNLAQLNGSVGFPIFRANRLDALVFPTVPRTAPPCDTPGEQRRELPAVYPNTDPGSNAGVPGLQLPMGIGAASQLPIGLEVDGPAGSDRRLIAVGLALEAVLSRLPAAR